MNKAKMTNLVFAIFLLLNLPAFADDTLMGEAAHTVYPINTGKIRLEYEHVVIKMDGSNNNRIASVKCKFEFINPSEQAITAKVGFPGNKYDNDPMSHVSPNLTLFTALVNGKEKQIDVREEVIKETSYDDFKVKEYRYWYTWDATFPAAKTTYIENSYSFTPSSDSVVWQVEYVLKTGSNWKGNIGQAIIEVWYPSAEDLKTRVKDIKPAGYQIVGRRIIWDLRDFKPKEDIEVVEKWIR